MPTHVKQETYRTTPELLRFKQELAARAYLQQADSVQGPEEEKEDKVAPEEKARKLMYHMIMDSQALTPEEFKYVTKSVGLPEVRIQIADLFSAFATPRKITEDKCFYNLGAICRAILEIYKVNCSDELKELHSLMVIG